MITKNKIFKYKHIPVRAPEILDDKGYRTENPTD